MHRFLIIVFVVALAGALAGWSALAQDYVLPALQDPPPIEKPKEPPPKEKDKPGKDEKPAKEEPQESAEEQTLKGVKLPTDGPGLLNYFRKRSVVKVDPKELAKLVKQLVDNKDTNTDLAFRDLVSYRLL